MDQSISDHLRACPDFHTFSDSEIDQIANISKLMYFDKGHNVFSIEHQDKYIFVVIDGMLSLRLHYEHRSKKFKERDLFGEITLFSNGDRLGVIQCLEDVTLVAIDKTSILNENDVVSDATRFKFLQAMGQKMTSYFQVDREKTIEELVNELESEHLEFKSSLDPQNWNKMVRTVAAFMNLNGGNILCGVKDGGGQQTYFVTSRKAVDDFELKFRTLITQHLGEQLAPIQLNLIEVNNRHIVKINVEPASHPIFYKDTDEKGKVREYFYIRSGNKNHPIELASDIVSYIHKRFKTNE